MCSSDLIQTHRGHAGIVHEADAAAHEGAADDEQTKVGLGRSEERRVGKEGRSRWSPDH